MEYKLKMHRNLKHEQPELLFKTVDAKTKKIDLRNLKWTAPEIIKLTRVTESRATTVSVSV